MPADRRIYFSAECDEAARRLGGYAAIDRSLDAFWDGLLRNPYGFPKFESDWISFRYVITKPIPGVPPLVWTFTIASDEIVLQFVEEFSGY